MTSSVDRDPASCDHEAARLLPWLVVGALSEREMERVQEHLRVCSICEADWGREQKIQASICNEPTVEHAPQPGLQNLMSRIDELERELPAAQPIRIAAPARMRRVRLVHWLAAAVIVQTVGLGILAVLLWQRGVQLQAPRFQTLTSTAPLLDGAAHIRVVFAPRMQVGEMQELLDAMPGRIVSGPSEAGVYTIALVDERSSVGSVLAMLRADPKVLFAEPQAAGQIGP